MLGTAMVAGGSTLMTAMVAGGSRLMTAMVAGGSTLMTAMVASESMLMTAMVAGGSTLMTAPAREPVVDDMIWEAANADNLPPQLQHDAASRHRLQKGHSALVQHVETAASRL